MTNHHQLKALIKRHKEQFIEAISLHYPLEPEQLEAYSTVLDFKALSRNKNCNWDLSRVKKFKNRLDFGHFQANSKCWFDTGMIDYFLYQSPQNATCVDHTKMPFKTIETNPFVPWSSQLIEKYDHILDIGALCFNRQVPWSIGILEKYFTRLNWNELSLNRGLPFSDDLISNFYKSWNWSFLSMNESIPWTLSLFDKYKNDINLDIAWSSGYPYEVITGNYDIVNAYPHLFDWSRVCSNQNLPWVEKDLLKKWHHRLNWYGLAGNEIFFRNDNSFFDKNMKKWEQYDDVFYEQFSGNSALPWSEALIDEYFDEWDWSRLATNAGLPWSTAFLDKYVEFFCVEPTIDGDVEVEPGGLRVFHKVPWTLDWIIRYEKYINFGALLHNENIWNKIFKPVIDDEVVRCVLD